MPADCSDSECLETYIETCAYISALFKDTGAVQLVVGGYFNCQFWLAFL